MDLFRGVLRINELSHRTLLLTEAVIDCNSANYSAWHYRRLCLEALKSDLKEELTWVATVALDTPKNYQVRVAAIMHFCVDELFAHPLSCLFLLRRSALAPSSLAAREAGRSLARPDDERAAAHRGGARDGLEELSRVEPPTVVHQILHARPSSLLCC
jgi:hypothetical protein